MSARATTDGAWVHYLEQVGVSPDGATVKDAAAELLSLRLGDNVVDVGCGPASDTIRFGLAVGPTGTVHGFDTDVEIVSAAEQAARDAGVGPWVHHRVASALDLPLGDSSVDAWHAERVLQHLPVTHGLAALRDAHRVVRPGGRLVVVDTDWASLSIETDQPDIERRLTRFHTTRLSNGFAGRMLPRLVRQAGWVRTELRRHAATISGESLDYLLAPTEQAALGAGVITALEWHQWRRGVVDLAATGDGFATIVMTTVAAVRP